MTLVLLDAKADRTRAAAVTYTAATGKVGAPVQVADVEGKLAAADLTPLEGSDPAAVNQLLHLLTTADGGRQLAYHTLPLAGGTAPEPRRVAGPVVQVDHWSITAAMSECPVLARAGARLLVSKSAGAAWSGLAEAAAPPWPALIASEDGDHCFVEWLDPGRGFRIVQVLGREI